jgi:hypothetical protein
MVAQAELNTIFAMLFSSDGLVTVFAIGTTAGCTY